jgi:SPP1 family predicted phage head-tail adaptor
MMTTFIDPGALRTELSLQACTAQPDGLGGFSEIWSEVGTVFGRMEPVSADSRFGADQTLETATHRITLRYREGIASGMRFLRAGRALDILTVHDPDETGRYLVCKAREAGR